MGRARKKQGNPKKAVGYLRVSTEEQALGPEAQREALKRWCASHGVELVDVHVDQGVSGGTPLDKRPALLAAVEVLETHGAGVLLVAKRDRLARDIIVAAMVERLAERVGARIVSAAGEGNGEGPEAMLMRGVVDLFAQYERAIIKHRTRAALSVKRARGERTGSIPYGFQLSGDGHSLEPCPAEERVISMIQDLRAEGETLQAITDRLNRDEVPARGRRWHLTTVARILNREAA